MTPENDRRLRDLAHQLASRIETLTGLTAAERLDLRFAPCLLLEIADSEAGIAAPEPPDMPMPRRGLNQTPAFLRPMARRDN